MRAAFIHCLDGKGGEYAVVLDGELLVTGFDPEFDAARALLDEGVTGYIEIRDARTGAPRNADPRLGGARSR
jgi:hypothetical protein